MPDFELSYIGKKSEEDILSLATFLATGISFKEERRFGEVKVGEWYNKLIFGDNFKALCRLKKLQEEGSLDRMKLIYIDPPFATEQEFKGDNGETHYKDNIAGAEFLEFLRNRLILLRELLAENGSIFVHCDWHAGHYIKVIMDEVFGKSNFRNELHVKRTPKHTAMQFEKVKTLQVASDSILVYAKSSSTVFNKPYKEASKRQKKGNWHGFSDKCYRPKMRYELFGLLPPSPRGRWIWSKDRAERAAKNYQLFEEALKQEEVSSFEEFVNLHPEMEFVRYNNGSPQYWISAREKIMADTNWNDVQAYSRLFSYATEKSEPLLERIIKMTTNENDLVLDCFAGSGTTGAVAEKLGRRWIMVDSSEIAISIIIERLRDNLREKIGNKGKKLNARPFTLYNIDLEEGHPGN